MKFFLTILSLFALTAHAAVFDVNQVVIPPYTGILVSTSSSGTGKISTTLSPTINSLTATGTATSTFDGGITSKKGLDGSNFVKAVLGLFSSITSTSTATSTFAGGISTVGLSTSNGLRISGGALSLGNDGSFTSLLGTGLSNIGGVLTASAGSSFSTTSADYWKSSPTFTIGALIATSTATSTVAGGLLTNGLASSFLTVRQILVGTGAATGTSIVDAATSTFGGGITAAGLSSSQGVTVTAGNILNKTSGTSTVLQGLTATGIDASSGITISGGGFRFNSETFTDLTGTGLQNTNGALTLNATGDWTGTFDSYEGTYYFANSFSTTSANYWRSSPTFTIGSLVATSTATSTFAGGVKSATGYDGKYFVGQQIFLGTGAATGTSIVDSATSTFSGGIQAVGLKSTNGLEVSGLVSGYAQIKGGQEGELQFIGAGLKGLTINFSGISENATYNTPDGSGHLFQVTGNTILTITGSGMNFSGTATTTSTNGMTLSTGCYAIGSTCVGGSNHTGSGVNGQVTFWNGANSQSGNSNFIWDNPDRMLGIATSAPQASLSIAATSTSANSSAPLMLVSTSTANSTSTAFIIDANGRVGIGTTTPISSDSLTVDGGIRATSIRATNIGLNAQSMGLAASHLPGDIQLTQTQQLFLYDTSLNRLRIPTVNTVNPADCGSVFGDGSNWVNGIMTGTTNQITVTCTAHAPVLSTPQNLDTANTTFQLANIGLGQAGAAAARVGVVAGDVNRSQILLNPAAVLKSAAVNGGINYVGTDIYFFNGTKGTTQFMLNQPNGQFIFSTSTGFTGHGTTTPSGTLSVAAQPAATTPVFIVSTTTAGNATSTAFVIDNNGKVAISTTTPNSAGPLSVGGSSGASSTMFWFGKFQIDTFDNGGNHRCVFLNSSGNLTSSAGGCTP